jgi:hypothetical protein
LDIAIRDRCEISIKDPYTDEPLVKATSDLSKHNLSGLRDRLREDLDKFRKPYFAENSRGLKNASDALSDLHRRGRRILRDLFGAENMDKLKEASRICQEAFPAWDQPGWDPRPLPPRIFVVRTAVGDGIPVEMLPLFNLNDPKPAKDMKELGHIAASFLGFSAIVKRDVGAPPPGSMRLDNTRGLPIKMFIYRKLPGARDELRFFEDPKNGIDSSAWPDGQAPGGSSEFCKALARHIWEPGKTFALEDRNPPYQVYHFSCHCDTTAASDEKYKLIFDSDDWLGGGKREVEHGLLSDALVQLQLHDSNNRPRPLVFLNACGSADFDPNGTGSFPRLFVRSGRGFMGFIGTEAIVPDPVAKEFSKMFYTHLLKGHALGTVLYATRWELLRRFNPLGILYSLYAEPEIRVRRPIMGLVGNKDVSQVPGLEQVAD